MPSRPGPVFRGLLLLHALMAVVVPALLVRWTPAVTANPARVARRAGLPPRKVVPPTVVPDVEPVVRVRAAVLRYQIADIVFHEAPSRLSFLIPESQAPPRA